MNSLARQRCFNHSGREAAARCTACQRHFCRECVTLHAGLMTCGSCLNSRKGSRRRSARPRSTTALAVLWPLSLLLLWAAFYSVGRLLILTPSKVHNAGIQVSP